MRRTADYNFRLLDHRIMCETMSRTVSGTEKKASYLFFSSKHSFGFNRQQPQRAQK